MLSRRIAAALLSVALLAGCGSGSGEEVAAPTEAASSSSPTAATEATTPISSSAPASPTEAPLESEAENDPNASPREGIDASHHQGPIDWALVADHGISFAYLKASEGTGFVDPRFTAHRRAAAKQGIDVAGYHYFQLCSDGAAQADHFISVLGKSGGALAPAVDLEIAGSCDQPPARGVLLAEVREFLAVIDKHYDTTTVVYLYPDFEQRFGFAKDLADHPQWVRRLGDRPPGRDWQIWQYSDSGTVPGIAGGVDLNLMQPDL